MSTSWAKKRAFQGNIASMEQKCHDISLFWLEMTISRPVRAVQGQEMTIFDKHVIFGLKSGIFWLK
jgi:hypothetical protein